MNTIRNIAFVIALTAPLAADPAHSQECSNLSEELIATHEALYEYALVAESAYGQSASNSCLLQTAQRRIQASPHRKLALLLEDVEEIWKPQILERWSDRFIPRPDNMGRYVDDDGVTYVTCDYDNINPQLALTWTKLRRTQENGEDSSLVDVILDVVVVVLGNILPSGEELGLVRLTRDPPVGDAAEELVAIRGTDFTQVPQIMASVNDLLGTSCVFEVAATVVDYIGDGMPNGRISVVGHSLGGTAAQYIAQDHTQNPWRNPANHEDSTGAFGAYSFNAVGLDNDHAGNADPSSLHSYVIDGEIVSSWFAGQFGRTQAGSVIRYLPQDSWPPIGEVEFIETAFLRGEAPEAVRRHRLPAVQKGLCECMNGYGQIVLDRP